MLTYKLTEDTTTIQIDDEKFQDLIGEHLRAIIQTFSDNGFTIRLVGGMVRDILLGETPRDLDFISTALPDEIIFILSELDLDIDSFNVYHGTVKVIVDGTKYEITALNYQMYKDKSGNIKTISHGTWEDDVKRRDFTVNAMSMDLDGKVYDYLNGIDDLQKGIIRPIPDFDTKIKNDPILILRFFKMLAKFKNAKYPKSALTTVIDNLDLVNNISIKRIKREIQNIKESPNADKTLAMMRDIGLMKILETRIKSE